MLFREAANQPRTYELLAEWRPDGEYSLEIDSAAFCDIYGRVSNALKKGFKVRSTDSYSTLLVNVIGAKNKHIVAQLISGKDKVTKETVTDNGVIEFFYVMPGTYYIRMFYDDNKNGKWDTGNFDENLQPEMVFFYPDKVECKEKWDITLSGDTRKRNPDRGKPEAIKQQKADQQKTIKRRNLERAAKLGIEYVKDNMTK